MTVRQTFLIADIAFALSCDHKLFTPAGLGKYGGFADFGGSIPYGASSVPVSILTTPAETAGWKIVFDADSWQANRAGDLLYLTAVNPGDLSRPTVIGGIEGDEGLIVHQVCLPGFEPSVEPDSVYSPMRHPLDKALLMHLLPRYSGFMIHAAGMVKNGRGLVCSGVSGAGKSTLSAVADAAGWRILTDERPIVRGDGDAHRVYGTPWPGDGGFARNESAPLAGMVFLTQSSENRARRLSPLEAIQRLMPVVSIPMYDVELVTAYAATLDHLISRVPCYELHFTPDERVLPVLESLLG